MRAGSRRERMRTEGDGMKDRMGRKGEVVQPMRMLLAHGFASEGRCIRSTASTSSNNIIVSHDICVE